MAGVGPHLLDLVGELLSPGRVGAPWPVATRRRASGVKSSFALLLFSMTPPLLLRVLLPELPELLNPAASVRGTKE